MAEKRSRLQRQNRRGTIFVDPNARYPMNLPRMGHAVIVNNVAEEYKGSMLDVQALKTAYETIGFDVQVKCNLNVDEMRRLRKWIMNEENHRDSNAFALTAFCHGNRKGHLLDIYRNKAWDTELFVADLSDVETLQGKPKIIVINSCRGTQIRDRSGVVRLLSEDDDVESPQILPDKADLFLAHSTVPGYVAYAGEEDYGSLYIQTLAKYLQKYYSETPLNKILMLVRQYMIKSEQGQKGVVQCPEERNTLVYEVLFSEYQIQQNKTEEELSSENEETDQLHQEEETNEHQTELKTEDVTDKENKPSPENEEMENPHQEDTSDNPAEPKMNNVSDKQNVIQDRVPKENVDNVQVKANTEIGTVRRRISQFEEQKGMEDGQNRKEQGPSRKVSSNKPAIPKKPEKTMMDTDVEGTAFSDKVKSDVKPEDVLPAGNQIVATEEISPACGHTPEKNTSLEITGPTIAAGTQWDTRDELINNEIEPEPADMRIDADVTGLGEEEIEVNVEETKIPSEENVEGHLLGSSAPSDNTGHAEKSPEARAIFRFQTQLSQEVRDKIEAAIAKSQVRKEERKETFDAHEEDEPTQRQFVMKLVSNQETELGVWPFMRFAVMPSTGDIIMWGKIDDDKKPGLIWYNIDSKTWSLVLNYAFCEHEKGVYLLPFDINGTEVLAISCSDCHAIRLLNVLKRKVMVAFQNVKYNPGVMCFVENSSSLYFVHAVKGEKSIIRLDCSKPRFSIQKVYRTTLESCFALAYIPGDSDDIIAMSDPRTGVVNAISCTTGEIVWELKDPVGKAQCRVVSIVFCRKYNVVLACDVGNKMVLILDPKTGSLTQAIPLRVEIGVVYDMCLFDNQVLVFHEQFDKLVVSSFILREQGI